MPQYGLSGTIWLHGGRLIEPFELRLSTGWSGLLGPSGSGKSTLLRLIGGLQCEARLEGCRKGAERIGWMAQSDLMQPRLSVLQNVMLIERLAGRKADPERARALLASVGLSGYEKKKPDALSGGQRQRVALARTLMSDADLILLDEPFSALDPATRATMQELAFEHFAGRTVLLVTHDPAEALRLCQSLWLLKAGRLHEVAALPGQTVSKPHALDDPALAEQAALLLNDIRMNA
ncbi:ATP-binding cassette domain-containing protein [uncultured Cohaesibacter sp.]|uniref:ABC transporter ATP-binding protein n=1 Tax=uncultured Cohaesibacter sp. TaxID=1002546 RepID=UPI0029C70826|nr:ATP-binding cassette domain-containing protein [uncultured Cohaesibacter sp.]